MFGSSLKSIFRRNPYLLASRYITLKDLDPHSFATLEQFRAKTLKMYKVFPPPYREWTNGGMTNDMDENGISAQVKNLGMPEFQRLCNRSAFYGNVSELFLLLDKDRLGLLNEECLNKSAMTAIFGLGERERRPSLANLKRSQTQAALRMMKPTVSRAILMNRGGRAEGGLVGYSVVGL